MTLVSCGKCGRPGLMCECPTAVARDRNEKWAVVAPIREEPPVFIKRARMVNIRPPEEPK